MECLQTGGDMLGALRNWLSRQTRDRVTVLAKACRIAFRPSTYVEELRSRPGTTVGAAFKFFLSCVGLALAAEAVFSLTFDTAFSDIVHHSFPILVALLGSVTLYALLLLLGTPRLHFKPTLATALETGGAAVLLMVGLALALLTADFLASYQEVKSSPCGHRTIICLLSGGTLTTYDLPRRTTGTLGWSGPLILLVILATIVHSVRVLARALEASQGVAPWRTYLVALTSLALLSPASLLTINLIYSALYGQP